MIAYAKKSELRNFRKNDVYPCKSGYTRDWEYPWSYLNSNLKRSLKILDIGSGNSDFPVFLKNKGHNVYIIDIPNKPGWGINEFLKKEEKIEYHIEDVRMMSWKNDTFDRVYCISVLEHLETKEDIIKTLEEIGRVLKKGGLAVITYDSYLKEFPRLKGVDVEETIKKLKLKLYKKGTIKKNNLKDEELIIASEGKILPDLRLGRLFCFKKHLKKYSNIYAVIGVTLQK